MIKLKNILAENMLRFGVKNLSESNVKKINEALLTEAIINLKGDPRLPKVAKSLATQWNNEVKLPAAAMGEYIFIMPRNVPQPTGGGEWNTGQVLKFWTYGFKPVGNVVTLQDWPAGFGGRFELATSTKIFGETVNFDPLGSGVVNASPQTVAEKMNMLNQIPLDVLNAAWAAEPNKANFAKTMSAFNNSPAGRTAMDMLTGNAKAFYANMLTTPAAPAAPGTPAPKKQN
jgi:hypothetical protein